jgi:hypothetical protein
MGIKKYSAMKSNPSAELAIDGFLLSRLATMARLFPLLPRRASAEIRGQKGISAKLRGRSQQEVTSLKPAARGTP